MDIYKDGNKIGSLYSINQIDAFISNLTNNFSNYYTKEQTKQLIAQITQVVQVNTLPQNPTRNTLYYVGTQAPYNIKLIDSDGNVIDLGTTDMDLSNYLKITSVDNQTITYDNATEKISSKAIIEVSELPEENILTTVLYKDNGDDGKLKHYDGSNWIEIGKPNIIDKTETQYNNMSEQEKNLDNTIYMVPVQDAGEDEKYSDFIKIIANNLYPVGSVYISVNSVSPATIFGGTWEQFGQGKTLVGIDANDTDFNTIEKTGGEKTHILTIQEMPSHNHLQNVSANETGSGLRRDYDSDGPCSPYSQGMSTGSTGGGQAHNNLQPYIVVYMWKRIS